MKVVFDIPDEVVAQLAQAVVEAMQPMLKASAVSDSLKRDAREVVSMKTDAPIQAIPQEGYLRLKEVLRLIPVSKSTWYKGVADGRYPKPTDRFGPRIAAWDAREIRRLLESNPGQKGRALSA